MPHGIRLPPSVRINQLRDNEVRVRHGSGLGNGQRVPLNRPDGPPHVDDLHAALEEGICLVREVVPYAREGRVVGLVDMDALDWTAGGAVFVLAGGMAANGVVEDEDFRRAGSSAMQAEMVSHM